MATLDDLKKSISQMSEDELFELLRGRRAARLTEPKRKAPKRKSSGGDPTKKISPDMALKLLEALGELDETGNDPDKEG